jgi:hypothetical protein
MDYRDRELLAHEALQIEAKIQDLKFAKDVMDKYGVGFNARQEAILEWYENKLLEIEILLTPEDEEFDEENPQHGYMVLGSFDWLSRNKDRRH